MGDFEFAPDRQGFVDLRNSGFVQDACLGKAREVAAQAAGLCKRAFECDVRPGRNRCHARASCRVGAGPPGGRRDWYSGAYSDAAKAAAQAARSCGGTGLYTRRKGG